MYHNNATKHTAILQNVAVQNHRRRGGRLWCNFCYRKTSNISRTLVGNKIVDNSDVVGASPVDAAPTTSSFST